MSYVTLAPLIAAGKLILSLFRISVYNKPTCDLTVLRIDVAFNFIIILDDIF